MLLSALSLGELAFVGSSAHYGIRLEIRALPRRCDLLSGLPGRVDQVRWRSRLILDLKRVRATTAVVDISHRGSASPLYDATFTSSVLGCDLSPLPLSCLLSLLAPMHVVERIVYLPHNGPFTARQPFHTLHGTAQGVSRPIPTS